MKKSIATILGLPLAGALLLAPGCGDDTSYSYFSVKVTLDESASKYPPYFDHVYSCGANVVGADVDFGSLACKPGGSNGLDLGTFEWSTSAKSGTVQFVVTVKDRAGNEIGRGMSSDVGIVPNGTATTSVVVTPDPEALKPPI